MPITQISGPGAFVNGGNALGADLTIGTLDAYALVFVTNGVERARFTSTGELVVVGPVVTINSTVVDIADRVIHVNSSTGANDPVPALITGLGVHRGAVAGVARDHADIVWDEGNARWNFAFNTGGDDITLGSDLAVKLSTLQASADVRLITNAKSIYGRNSTDTADVEIARVDSSDRVSIAQGGASVLLGTGALSWSGAAGNAMNLSASGTGTVDVQSATGTIRIGTTGSARTVAIGTGAAAQTVQIGSQDTTSSLLLDSGTGNIDIGTGAQARAVNVGTGGAQQTVVVGSTNGASSLKLDSGTGAINIGTGAQARSVNVGTGAAAQAVTVGSTTAGSTTTIQGPTIGVAATSSLAINNSGGAINIGTNADAQPINIGTGAANRAINVGTGAGVMQVTVGSTNTTSSLTLNSGTGNIDIGGGAQARSINIGVSTQNQSISIGTGSGQMTVALGSTGNANNALSLNAGGTGQITANARTNIKAAAGLYITDASSNGIYINQAAGTTHQLVGTGTTTTLRFSPILELNNSITCLTDKSPNIGTEAARVNTITSQTSANKTHDAFTGSQVFSQTGAVQTTDTTVTTIFTYAVPDNCGAWMDIRVTGRDTGGSNRGMWVRNASVSRQAGGAANVDSNQTIGTDYNPGTWGGVTVTTSGNNVIVRVTGKTTTTINWACAVRYQAVIANT